MDVQAKRLKKEFGKEEDDVLLFDSCTLKLNMSHRVSMWICKDAVCYFVKAFGEKVKGEIPYKDMVNIECDIAEDGMKGSLVLYTANEKYPFSLFSKFDKQFEIIQRKYNEYHLDSKVGEESKVEEVEEVSKVEEVVEEESKVEEEESKVEEVEESKLEEVSMKEEIEYLDVCNVKESKVEEKKVEEDIQPTQPIEPTQPRVEEGNEGKVMSKEVMISNDDKVVKELERLPHQEPDYIVEKEYSKEEMITNISPMIGVGIVVGIVIILFF